VFELPLTSGDRRGRPRPVVAGLGRAATNVSDAVQVVLSWRSGFVRQELRSDMGDKGRTDTVKEALGNVARQARTLADRAAKLIGDEPPKKVRGETANAEKAAVGKRGVQRALATST